ncbi:MAG TPA: ABC transporter ATP-binding protein [bacterium]|nr:ABC transporter ATP-binding protein [bacterium]HPG36858.1 ABC transporter ATP-binding protein [bacterium]HPM47446.1 ABC transporter ATP-binding protein [bacterium]HPY15042.1 ABC transporter ATP-binding protein [bacterium]HQB10554.1 ABC transporter ATP-binding protein [bacterium]
MDVIKVENVTRTYKTGEIEVHALRGVDLTIRKGEFTAIAGPSGSGKTTLLNIIGGLDTPSSGDVVLGGKLISKMSGSELSNFRRDHVGFIFQSYNLIPVLTVEENIEFVMLLQGVERSLRSKKVKEILEVIGLTGSHDRLPSQLSGGQQQRVAVARAIVSEPDIILADEPTANLDSVTGSALLDMMKKLNEEKGITFIFSTHDKMIMERAKRLVKLHDGKIQSDETR